MLKKGRRTRAAISGRMERVLELPGGTLTDIPHIELTGRREAIVEGCHGILSYDDDAVRLNTGCGILRITGQCLTLRAMNNDSALVSGRILSLEFLG